MLDELYKKSMEDVEPDELLVQRTKNLMKAELKKKPKNFYKYASIAACLIITFSLFRIAYDSSNDVYYASESIGINNSISTLDKNMEGAPNTGRVPISRPSIDANFSSSADMSTVESVNGGFLGSIFKFFESIIEWVGNLFN